MTHSDAVFAGSIPEVYERYLVPMLFTPYAADIVTRVQAVDPRRVLDVAAGTGIVTRGIALMLPDAQIDGTDLNAGMIGFAEARSETPRIRWSVADAMQLPFKDGSFDLVVCQFGVMFFPDRVRAFREARRVLTHGGTYVFNVWDSLETNDLARIVSETAEAAFPEDPPLFIRRTPHGHGDPAAIEHDLREAGFEHVEYSVVDNARKRRPLGPQLSASAKGRRCVMRSARATRNGCRRSPTRWQAHSRKRSETAQSMRRCARLYLRCTKRQRPFGDARSHLCDLLV
jgi:ubiquinone/menaquinone biosynthesis C-methylase UbiE